MGAHDREEADAQAAAERWLALVDAGDYDAAWAESARLMTSQVDAATLAAGLRNARSLFGAFEGRSFVSKDYATSLPGAPDGEYVVLQTRAKFAQKQDAVETITPMKEPDGTWRVSGYFIR